MTQTAVVIKIHGPGLCEVRVRRTAACGDSCDSCNNLCETPDIDVLAVNTEGARPGDLVLIEGSRTLLLAALVYLAPIVLFLLGWLLHPIAGAVGILIGVGGVLYVNRFLQDKGGVSAKVVAIVERAE
ncbi:MAG: SoxR reducing system RseC family protein [Oscillospiraceae bacterium]|jgi:positive regulator of sigma E activity|nr:SoxR reducing system RseC family protein [Oscillospiraceae bacterium]